MFQIHDKLFVGLTGLATDVLSVEHLLQLRCNMYKLRENRNIKPQAFSAMLSSLLYEKRFGPWFTEPIVAGLTEDDQPFISGMDLIGAPVLTSDFVVAGTCTANMHGMCEALYRPDMVRSPPLFIDSYRRAPMSSSRCYLSASSRQWTEMPTAAGVLSCI